MEREKFLNNAFSGCKNLIQKIDTLEEFNDLLIKSFPNKAHLSKCLEHSDKIKKEIESLLKLTKTQESQIAGIMRNYLNEALELIKGYQGYLEKFDKLNVSNIQNLGKILKLLKNVLQGLGVELSAELKFRKAA